MGFDGTGKSKVGPKKKESKDGDDAMDMDMDEDSDEEEKKDGGDEEEDDDDDNTIAEQLDRSVGEVMKKLEDIKNALL
jgi:hypothetical protein